MARRLFTLCSTLSLLLSIAACALWVRSYRHLDRFSADFAGREHSVATVRGTFHWFVSPDPDHTFASGFSSVRAGEWLSSRGAVGRVGAGSDVFPGQPILTRHWMDCVTATGQWSPCVAEIPVASPAGPVWHVVPLREAPPLRPRGPTMALPPIHRRGRPAVARSRGGGDPPDRVALHSGRRTTTNTDWLLRLLRL